MKKQLLTLLFAISSFITFSQIPSYVPTNGLVGWWPFNGNANDESGNGNNGTVNGATLTADRNGLANKAYSFDGINDLINVGNPTQLLNNPISYSQSVWIYLYDSPVNFNSYPIISKRHDDLGNDWATAVFRSTQKIWFFADDSYYSAATYANSSTLSFGTWKHAVFVKEDNTYKIYLDGVLDVSIIDSHIMSGSSNDLIFGAQLAWPQYYKGLIDDIAIFNRALSQQEITDLYNSCRSPTATIIPQGSTTFCQGGSVNLNATSGTNYTYEWYKDGQLISGAITNIYQVTSSGNYTVKVIDGPCYATSSATNVTVNANPTVTLSSIPSVVYKTSAPIQLVGNPTGGTFSGEAVSGSTFTPANASLGQKVISYSYTTQQGCSGSASQTTIVADTVGNVCSTYDTLRIKVKFTAGLYANTTNTVKFYPNPTNDILFIDNGNYQAMSGYSIKIVSLTGTVVYNQPITTQKVQISMNQFAVKGLYFAQIFDPNNQLVEAKKIVLE